MIFQDPYASLNPRATVGEIISRPLTLHTNLTRLERSKRAISVLDRVGLQADAMRRYPHEFSGGQRQRIGIARALITRPKLIIADEPVSALDVSVQAQVINLMQELQGEFGLTYLFIAHDLSVVYHVADRIAVMYLGNIVEIGEAEQIYRNPKHPYSRALLSAVPQADPSGDRAGRTVLEGDIPTPLSKPTGCAFRTRCPIAQPDCGEAIPPLIELDEGRAVACPYAERYDELAK
jgi:oligopeptide/dipeptide ABC transporter ATP-binding protein